ncbi:MAG: hypothetical protein ACOCG5_02710 [Candidatus Alkaliphilus sp. MAG34]|nr:hypothetical protein [Clostridiales bacterium]
MEKQEHGSQVQSNWLLFFLFLLFVCRKDTGKSGFQGMDPIDLDKKSRLLNKIKGYMSPQDQYIIHSAEIVLQIIAKVKTLLDLPQTEMLKMEDATPNPEDKKYDMLAGLGEFLEGEISESLLTNDTKEKTVELKKLTSVLGIIDNLRGKKKMSKSEIMEIVRPFVDKEQEDSLMRMVQAFGAMDDMKGAGIEPVN